MGNFRVRFLKMVGPFCGVWKPFRRGPTCGRTCVRPAVDMRRTCVKTCGKPADFVFRWCFTCGVDFLRVCGHFCGFSGFFAGFSAKSCVWTAGFPACSCPLPAIMGRVIFPEIRTGGTYGVLISPHLSCLWRRNISSSKLGNPKTRTIKCQKMEQ